jgi:hypothetical protein|tara:strand:- start:92 stop:214 length:123 start_codon:yes stop_codon:yes gene_type:complete
MIKDNTLKRLKKKMKEAEMEQRIKAFKEQQKKRKSQVNQG